MRVADDSIGNPWKKSIKCALRLLSYNDPPHHFKVYSYDTYLYKPERSSSSCASFPAASLRELLG